MKINLAMVVVVVAVFVILAALARLTANGRTGSYKRRNLLTDNELEFFDRLVKALPAHYIFPQVAMSA
ncbi:hypothetical protein CIW54_22985, partial [Paraburkholderia sp. T12-10]